MEYISLLDCIVAFDLLHQVDEINLGVGIQGKAHRGLLNCVTISSEVFDHGLLLNAHTKRVV